MHINYIKTNPLFSIFLYLFIIVSIFTLSYNFLITNFTELEKEQNKNNINTILSAMNSNIKTIANIIKDYSNWDDSYNFMNDSNKEYIYENFREGTTTLEDLDVNFMIYSNLKQKTLYSKYNTDTLRNNKLDFEKQVFKRFKEEKNANTVFKYKSHHLYLVKSEILKSDSKGKTNGHIYSGKIIKKEDLNKISEFFKQMNIEEKKSDTTDLLLNYEYLKNNKISTDYDNGYIKNNIQLYDNQDTYMFSIITRHSRDIVNQGKETIKIFNLVISVFLLIIFYILYKNQKMLEKYNKLLELKVDRRTQQLSRSLRKLHRKNKELHDLANSDSLTKINNRRSFFTQSEKALKKSIQNNTAFCVLLMDIDDFKIINDTYGHAVGDKVLKEFSTIVNDIIDENSIFGRIGGEEFCITFHKKDIDESLIISEKIRHKCENNTLILNNKEIKFTVSFGLSHRAGYTNIDDILHQSDQLLYKAKKGGKNCIIRTSSNNS